MNRSVSIVVPAFNAEQYLAECLDSIVVQHEVGEIIVVDDGSTDSTLQIAQDYSKHDSRIKVLHQPNSGVSVARNRGMDAVGLPWMAFVDADDILPENAVSMLLSAAEQYDVDMMYGDYQLLRNGQQLPGPNEFGAYGEGRISPDNIMMSLISVDKDSVSGSCWRILYRTSFLTDTQRQFPAGITMSEDYCFILSCLISYPKVAYTKRIVYLMRREGISATQCYMSSLEQSMNYVNDVLHKVCQGSDTLMDGWTENVANTAWTVCGNLYKIGAPYDSVDRRSEIYRIMDEYHGAIRRAHIKGSSNKGKVAALKVGSVCPFILWVALEIKNGVARHKPSR